MKRQIIYKFFIFNVLTWLTLSSVARDISFEFLGDTLIIQHAEQLKVEVDKQVISDLEIACFYEQLSARPYLKLLSSLTDYKNKHQLSDWLYYQLIRKTSQQISPKAENYYRYTLYKWFLLSKSGYQSTLALNQNHLLLYVRSDENIYEIPFFVKNNVQFICLNYHDYGFINFDTESIVETKTEIAEGKHSFSYKITQMPDFKVDNYTTKEIQFNYRDKLYQFNVKLNPEIKSLFTNYPVADFETYFNIPLSQETYSSLIPELRKNIADLSQINGVDYLMNFTRYSFLYENDQKNFGKEKRLSPEQTLLYEQSDCDDRVALFFYLVKEIYDLPMIVMLYPTHVTMAVHFDKPVGKPIVYNGKVYSMCDPTPQQKDTDIGQIARNLKNSNYEVVYEYIPMKK